jgi:hypothetical protein
MIKHDHENELSQTISAKDKSESYFSDHISHFETRRKTRYQHILAATRLSIHYSKQILIRESSLSRIHQAVQKKKIAASKKLIIVMFSKRREIKILKIKRLFSFIIVCYFKSLNTIQSFREIKRRDRLTLKDFHHIFQDVIAARQKDLELDSDYNFFSFKLFSSIISSQFFRKSTFDSFSDIDLFDLEVRSSSSLKSLNRSLDKHVSLEQLVSFVNSLRTHLSRNQSFRSYERKYQNDLSIQNNAIERFFRVSNMTDRNAKSADFHEFLTLRRSRRVLKLSNFDRRNLDRKDFQRSRRIINIKENQKIQNRQSQDDNDHSKSIKMQRSKSFEERDQRH